MNIQETNERTIGIYWFNTDSAMSAIETPKLKGIGKFQKKLKNVINKIKIGYP
jgi:hypothetical protein